MGWFNDVGGVVIDEAHRAVSKMYTTMLGWLPDDLDIPIVGLTATPMRGTNDQETQELIARFHDNLLPLASDRTVTLEALIRGGILSRARVTPLGYQVPFDLTPAQRSQLKQFNQIPGDALVRLGEREDYNALITQTVLDLPKGSRTLVFCASVKQARLLAIQIGIEARRGGLALRATHVDGKTSLLERHRRIEAFRRGEIQVLTNVQVLTTGFDAPQVDVVVVARPTMSRVLYLQMVGRGLRGPASGGTEQCLIINALDNMQRWGVKLPYEDALSAWRTGISSSPSVLQTTWTNYAVGQGGLALQRYQLGRATYNVVYDCGAVGSGNTLDRGLRRLFSTIGAGNVHMLVLSHLDKDHINGLKTLAHMLKRKGSGKVLRVVMPAWNVMNAALVLTRMAKTDPTRSQPESREMIRWIEDPVGELEGHFGSQVVVVMISASDPDTVEPMAAPEWSEPIWQATTGRPDDPDAHDEVPVFTARTAATVTRTYPAEEATVTLGSGTTVLVELLPYCIFPDVEASLRPIIERYLTKAQPNARIDQVTLLKELQDPSSKLPKRLKKELQRFRKVRHPRIPGRRDTSITNNTSLSLMATIHTAGAQSDIEATVPTLRPSAGAFEQLMLLKHGRIPAKVLTRAIESTGVLISALWTGDSLLSPTHYGDAMSAYYTVERMNSVVVAQLPHHGSARNSDPMDLPSSLTPRIWFASYGTDNSHNHPGGHLMAALAERGTIVPLCEVLEEDLELTFDVDVTPSSVQSIMVQGQTGSSAGS